MMRSIQTHSTVIKFSLSVSLSRHNNEIELFILFIIKNNKKKTMQRVCSNVDKFEMCLSPRERLRSSRGKENRTFNVCVSSKELGRR